MLMLCKNNLIIYAKLIFIIRLICCNFVVSFSLAHKHSVFFLIRCAYSHCIVLSSVVCQQNFPHFMEPESLLPRLQQPDTCPYPDQINPVHAPIPFHKDPS
jgi:hypothetical protein